MSSGKWQGVWLLLFLLLEASSCTTRSSGCPGKRALEADYGLFMPWGKSVPEVLGLTLGVPRERPSYGVRAELMK